MISIAVPYDDRWYFAELVRGARSRAEAAGHTARIHVVPPSLDSTAQAADAIERDFADLDSIGAIAAGFEYRADHSSRALTWHRPLVAVGGSVLGFPTVMIDDLGAARTAVEHLLALGHTRIAHFAGTMRHQMDFLIHSRRARGYQLAMEGAGLRPTVVENEFDPAAVHRTALRVLEQPTRPTAVFAVFDEVAFPVLAAARELGLRPGRDLSVIGIDDHPRAESEDLTTIRQQPAQIGATAVDMLLSGLSHGPDPKQSRLAPIALVKRGSTGRPVG